MKKITLLLLAAFVFSSAAFATGVLKVEREFGPSFFGYAPDKCIVVFKEGTSPIQANSRAGLAVTGNPALDQIARTFTVNRFDRQFPGAFKSNRAADEPLTRHYKAHFPEGNLDVIMDAYSKLPFVEKVEPIGIYRLTATPNDFYYDSSTTSFPYNQWHYWDSYGISNDLAWDKETGDPDVIVAVIDGGVRYYHYELGGTNPPGPNDNSTNGNIWVNDGEIPGNGTDDDNNGYIDDVIGWDFVSSTSFCTDVDCGTADNDPSDHGGHGTHVSGTIAAITNNDPSWGVAGIAGGWNDGTTNYTANGVKIMCLRAGWTSNFGGLIGLDYAAEAMYYVATMVDKGYNVTAINCSWGSSSILEAATNAVLARDVMVIVAAGNDNSSSCDYLGCREDCLDVGATDKYGDPASFSQYGTWIEVAAPGVEILSTYHHSDDPAGDYIALMDGTSMACPHVVGVAGLLESFNPALTGPEKFAIISDPANMKSYNMTKYVGAGIVDARKCLDAAGPPCDLVADFSGAPTTGCAALTVDFTDLSTGTGIDGWDWDFGDGVGTSTAQNPSYTYNNAGTYTVTLTVSSSSQGCNDTETKTGYITVQDVPVADFVGSPTSGNAPLAVDFTDLSSGNPTSWLWDFGDGIGTSTDQNPSYTYNDQGTYTVTLTASNSCGSDDEQKPGYINVTISENEFAYALSDIPVLGTVTNNYAYTHSSDNSYEVITEVESTTHPRKVTSYLEHKWDFSVNSTGTVTFFVEAYRPDNADGDNFTFAYSTDDVTYINLVTVASATEQVYSASLPNGLTGTVYIRVLDSDRAWDKISLDAIYIDNMYIEYESTPGPPVADFSGSPRSGGYPLLVSFTDLSTGNPTSWDWDFGDGIGTSADQNPTYTYNSAGSYTVTLTATNAYGSDTEIKTGYINVTEPGQDMYVYDMVVSRFKSGPYYYGSCTVTIYDNYNNPVSDAMVYVTATGPTGGNFNDVTVGDGTVYFETSGIKKPTGEWCFEVTDVTHATMTYNPGMNNVTYACESGPVFKQAIDLIPTEFDIYSYPNPFNAMATIGFNLPVATHVSLDIYNIAGQRVANLADRYYDAGYHTVVWDASNTASGIYFYRIQADEFNSTRKMVLLK